MMRRHCLGVIMLAIACACISRPCNPAFMSASVAKSTRCPRIRLVSLFCALVAAPFFAARDRFLASLSASLLASALRSLARAFLASLAAFAERDSALGDDFAEGDPFLRATFFLVKSPGYGACGSTSIKARIAIAAS